MASCYFGLHIVHPSVKSINWYLLLQCPRVYIVSTGPIRHQILIVTQQRNVLPVRIHSVSSSRRCSISSLACRRSFRCVLFFESRPGSMKYSSERRDQYSWPGPFPPLFVRLNSVLPMSLWCASDCRERLVSRLFCFVAVVSAPVAKFFKEFESPTATNESGLNPKLFLTTPSLHMLNRRLNNRRAFVTLSHDLLLRVRDSIHRGLLWTIHNHKPTQSHRG